MSEKITKPNLFSSAKKVDKKDSKTQKQSLNITPELEKHLKNYAEAKTQFKTWEGKKKIAEGVLKPYAVELYLQECKVQKRHIGSFKLGEVTVMVQDKYSSMEESVADVVAENFPDVVEKSTEYLLDQNVLGKYINEISEALQKSGIPEEDLAKLILVKEITNIKKGTIDTLPMYGERMDELFNAIGPVIAFR